MTRIRPPFRNPRRMWRPSPWRVVPPSLPLASSMAFWLAHYGRMLRNRDYAVLLLFDGSRVVHRTCVIPAYFRWPFMAPQDLQLSSLWTDPIIKAAAWRRGPFATRSIARTNPAGRSGTSAGKPTRHRSPFAPRRASSWWDRQFVTTFRNADARSIRDSRGETIVPCEFGF